MADKTSRLTATVAVIAAAAAMSPVAISSAAETAGKTASNHNWWPEKLDLRPLRQHSPVSNPMGEDFD